MSAPAPVPALPDTERRTSYSITAQTGPFAVNFAVYGDGTDFAEWIEVWLNGTQVAPGAWALSSPSGAIGALSRPITDAVITLGVASTGSLQIIGARRPRRTSEFAENRGVAARDLNQVLTDVVAQLREVWDRTRLRMFSAPGGETVTQLPTAALRANKLFGFDGSGNPLMQAVVPVGGLSVIQLTLTRSQIAGVTLALNTLAVSGFAAPGDPGAGAIYTSQGAGPGSPMAIQDASGTWFQLVLNSNANPGWFGAKGDGSTNDHNAFETMIAICNTAGVQIWGVGRTYKINSPLATVLDLANTSLSAMTLDFTSCVTGPVFTLSSTCLDPDAQAKVNGRNPFIGVNWIGPDKAAGVDGIVYEPVIISAVPCIYGVRMVDGGMSGFRDQLLVGDGAVAISWTGMQFGATLSHDTRAVLKITGVTGGGENWVFDHCMMVNATAAIWDQIGHADSEVILNSCSVECTYYVIGGAVTPGGTFAKAQVQHIGGHIETGGSASDYLMWSDSGIKLIGINWVQPFFMGHVPVRMEATNQGLLLDGVSFNNPPVAQPGDYFVDGPGRVMARNTSGLGNTTVTVSSISNNEIPTFTLPTSASLADGLNGFGWSAGASAFYVNANLAPSTPAAVGAIAIPANTSVSYTAPCSPGDWVAGGFWIKTSNVGGSLSAVGMFFEDAAGNVLLGTEPTFGVNVAYSAMIYIAGPGQFAPPGTVKVRLNFFQNNTIGATTFICLPGIYKQ